MIQIQTRQQEGAYLGTIGRIVGFDREPLTITDVSSWQVNVYDRDAGSSHSRRRPVYSLTGVVTATTNTNGALPGTPLVWSSALRTDSLWPGSATGYNFVHWITSGTNVVTGDGWDSQTPPVEWHGGKRYLIEYGFQTTFGPIFLQNAVDLDPVTAPVLV